jgi:hypothetical protein
VAEFKKRRTRRYKIYGDGYRILTRPGFHTVIQDSTTSEFNLLAEMFPVAADSAVRHVTYLTFREAEQEFRKEKHRRPLSKEARSRFVEKWKGVGSGPARRLRSKKYAGDQKYDGTGRGMEKANKYAHFRGKMRGIVGWNSKSISTTFSPIFQEGRQDKSAYIGASMKQARFLFAIAHRTRKASSKAALYAMAAKAVSMSGGSETAKAAEWDRKPRDIYDAVHQRMGKKIPKIMERRLLLNLGGFDAEEYFAILSTEVDARVAEQEAISYAKRAAKRAERRFR